MKKISLQKRFFLFFLFPVMLFSNSFNEQMQSYLAQLKQEAKMIDPSFTEFDIKRGEKIFSSRHMGKRGEMVSCESCHNKDITKEGKNIFTNKALEPLSPKVNSQRLSSVKEVKKWLRRNYKDVYVREGTAIEKGDVLYYINSK